MIAEQKIGGARKEEMKATGQTGNRQRATQKRKRAGAGKSALMMLNHPQEPKALYTSFFYWKKRGKKKSGSENEMNGNVKEGKWKIGIATAATARTFMIVVATILAFIEIYNLNQGAK